jgi:hypothetical protein
LELGVTLVLLGFVVLVPVMGLETPPVLPPIVPVAPDPGPVLDEPYDEPVAVV